MQECRGAAGYILTGPQHCTPPNDDLSEESSSQVVGHTVILPDREVAGWIAGGP